MESYLIETKFRGKKKKTTRKSFINQFSLNHFSIKYFGTLGVFDAYTTYTTEIRGRLALTPPCTRLPFREYTINVPTRLSIVFGWTPWRHVVVGNDLKESRRHVVISCRMYWLTDNTFLCSDSRLNRSLLVNYWKLRCKALIDTNRENI